MLYRERLLRTVQNAGQPAVKSDVNSASPVQVKRRQSKGAHGTPARLKRRGRGRRYMQYR
jgi:hypothetical protein